MFIIVIAFISFLATCAFAEPPWITAQYDIALKELLGNIYDNGTVIASPSLINPDYYVLLLTVTMS